MNTSGDEERRSSAGFNVQPTHQLQNGSGEPSVQQPPLQTPPSVSMDSSSMMQILKLMQQQMAQQQNILAQLMQQQGSGQSSSTTPEQILDSLCSHIKEFKYDAEAGTTFAAWYNRYEDLFERDAARLSDEAKVRLLMRKLGTLEHDRYVNFILPKFSRDFSLPETVAKLTDLFGTKESLLHRRFKCLNTVKGKTEDYLAYACRVNRGVVNFELGKLTEEQLKCLVFVCGLKDDKDVEIRQRLSTPLLTYQSLAKIPGN
ncbi:uncharacterized protein LOC120901245 [Anopheles arabiensis]|uniref:uncharacterized protein LOC120901245 n=1 Tax=Anopheles arabiensis TaxID=7173 RepID=UPI001AAE14B1|nr:uncharacterized protein LOC120901245 [Anopheles arabiensis]